MNEVNVRTMEFCRRWGVAEQVMSCPFPDDFPMDAVVVTKLGSYELGRIHRPARKDQQPGPFSPMNLQVCSQIWFDPIMRERAKSFSSVSLLYRHQLESFEADEDGVTAKVQDLNNGREVIFRSQYLAGCDGAGSRIRRSLGINLLGSDVLSSAMHIYFRARDPLGDLGVKRGTFFAVVDKDGYWGNIRAIDPANGLWRLLFDVPPNFNPKDVDYDKCIDRAFSKPLYVEWVGASQWTRRGVVAEKFSVGRVHLVGDAVHQLSPTGGLGMNTGVADAVDLGWKLAAAYEGWAGPHLLESYSIERQPACARNVKMATKYYEGQAEFREGTRRDRQSHTRRRGGSRPCWNETPRPFDSDVSNHRAADRLRLCQLAHLRRGRYPRTGRRPRKLSTFDLAGFQSSTRAPFGRPLNSRFVW